MKQKFIVIASLFFLASAAAPDVFSQWVQTNGPCGGDVIMSFALKGSNLFALTEGYGVFRSSNYGESWTAVNNGFGLPAYYQPYVNCIGVSGTTLFAGTDSGLYRSFDDGANWIPVSTGQNLFKTVTAIIVSGKNVIVDFHLGSGGQGYLSTDNGDSWTTISLYEVDAFAVSGDEIFTVYNYSNNDFSISHSTDAGATWVSFGNSILPHAYVGSLVVSGTTLLIGSGGSGVFRSIGGGGNCIASNKGLTNLEVHTLVMIGTNIFAGTVGGTFRSSDGGISWTPASTGLSQYTSVNAIAVIDTFLFAGTGGSGVYRSTNNGSNWILANSGLHYRSIDALASSDTNLFASTGYPGIFRSIDGGISWTPASGGLSLFTSLYSLAVSKNYIFGGINGNGVVRSSDDGINWIAANNGLTIHSVNSLASNGTNIFAGGNGGVSRSTDEGASWTTASDGLPKSDSIVFALVLSGANLFVGTWGDGIFKSTNNGGSWTAAGLPNTFIFALGVSGTDLFAETYDGTVYHSTNNGLNWIQGANFINWKNQFLSLAVSGTNVFVGTDSGVFRSYDKGMSWMAENNGLTRTTIDKLTVSGRYLFAGIDFFGGVWRRPLSDFGINAVPENKLPEQPIRNYPNPFSEKTEIKFSTAEQSFTQVSIYDLLGAEVGRIFSGELQAGEHVFIWDGSAMPAGMYIAIIKTCGGTREFPVLLVR